jgi:hypothetical protein
LIRNTIRGGAPAVASAGGCNDDQLAWVGGCRRIRRFVFLQADRDAEEGPGGCGLLVDHLWRGHRCRSSAVIALYLNVFVLIAQFFMKIPALKALAPTQSEPSFLGTQVVVMLIFIVRGVLAPKRFPAETVRAA